MSKHFKVLGFIANSFPKVAFRVVCSGEIASAEFEVVGKGLKYAMLIVGTKMRFEVLSKDTVVDSVESLSHEDESSYAGRIVNLINKY